MPSEYACRPRRSSLPSPSYEKLGVGDGQACDVVRVERDPPEAFGLLPDQAGDPRAWALGADGFHQHRLAEQRACQDLSFVDSGVSTHRELHANTGISRVLDHDVDIALGQLWIGLDDFVRRHAMSKEAHNMLDSEASTLHDRLYRQESLDSPQYEERGQSLAPNCSRQAH